MKKIIESMWLLLIGLTLTAVVYGGLTISKEVKASDKTQSEQLAIKIEDFQKALTKQSEMIAALENKLALQDEQIQSLKKRPISPKVAGIEQTEPAPAATAPAPEPIIKTVTKTVVVEEEPEPTANITIQDVGSFTVELEDNDTALTVLKRAAAENGFALDFQSFDFGVFVTAIGGIKPSGTEYWAFYYNGKYSMVGASDQTVEEGDSIYWRLEKF